MVGPQKPQISAEISATARRPKIRPKFRPEFRPPHGQNLDCGAARRGAAKKMIPAKPQPVVWSIWLVPARPHAHTTWKNNLLDELFDPSETPSSCLEHEAAHTHKVVRNIEQPARPESNGTRNSRHVQSPMEHETAHTSTRNSTHVQGRMEHETAHTSKVEWNTKQHTQ